MDDKKTAVRQIWQECFHDSRQWMDMFFSEVYDDDEALVLEYNGRPVSSMLLRRYMMLFHGEEIPVGYVSGAATRRHDRGHGYMSELIRIALRHARHRGDLLVSLIPASRRLFGFYGRLGFSTVFYIKEDRYTSLHSFAPCGRYTRVDNVDTDEVFDFFRSRELMRDGSFIHSRDDFRSILKDNLIDGGAVVAVRREDTDAIVALGFATVDEDDNRIVVKDLLAVDEDASEGLLDQYRRLYPDKSFTVIRPVYQGAVPIASRGMARIVNVGETLAVIARRFPGLKLNIRVSDDLIGDNNAVFMMDSGQVSTTSDRAVRLDLDVTVQTLALILFSTPKVGDVFGIPSLRPYMALMLE